MKLPVYIFVALLTLPLVGGVGIVSAQSSADQITYAPLEPLPGFENAANISFAEMLNLLFRVLFTAGALFAVGMLVFGGIMYMVSGAGVEMGEAKKRIQAAIFGLLLLAGAYLILYTINPQLLVFNISNIDSPTGLNNTGNGGTGGPSDVVIGGGSGVAIYDSMPPTTAQMNTYIQQCRSQGKTFKSFNSGTDEVGSYTEWRCE